MQHGRRKFLFLLVALEALAAVAVAQAAPSSGGGLAPNRGVRLFNIPAQDLPPALEAFSVVTGSQLIYDSRLVATHRSSVVVGLFTPEAALRMLLDGTNLTIRYNGPQEIALVATPEIHKGPDGVEAELRGADGGVLVLDALHVDVPPGAERPDYADYGRNVRLEIKRALAQNTETSNRIYQVQFDVFVTPKGHLQHSRLLRSSGKSSLDGAIRQVIETINLKTPPPEGMPQPVRVTIISI